MARNWPCFSLATVRLVPIQLREILTWMQIPIVATISRFPFELIAARRRQSWHHI